MTDAEREANDRKRQYRKALPQIRKTSMCATFRAPVSRPGADVRRECWAAETVDGVWGMEHQEGERYLKWALIYRPTDTLVTYASSLKQCREMIAIGSWTAHVAEPNPYGHYEGPVCAVAHWFRGTELHRGVFGTMHDAITWAQAALAKSRSVS